MLDKMAAAGRTKSKCQLYYGFVSLMIH